MSLPLDETLAQRSRAGDRSASFQLALRHWQSAYRIALNMLAPDPVATTEAALRHALTSPLAVEDAVPFRLVLIRAAVEESLSRIDGRGERAPAHMPEPAEERLRTLDATDRACLALCDGEELSSEEAAFVLRTEPRIVRLRAHRARLHLIGTAPELIA
jgi:DNA-directed RNA polymerase specialized sigma24 family protein